MKVKLLPAVLIGGAALFIFSKVSKFSVARSLQFVFQNFQAGWSGINPAIIVTLLIQNPTSETFTISAIAGDVIVNGESVGNVSSFLQTIVPALSQVPYNVNVLLSPGAAISQIVSLINGSSQAVNVELRGSANIENVQLPIDIFYKVV